MPKPSQIAALLAGSLILVLLAGRALRGCGLTEEDRVRDAIREIAAGVEEKDLGRALGPVAEQYHDAEGTTKQLLRGIFMYNFREHQKISVRIPGEIAVTIRKDGVALADFYATVSEGALDGIAGGGESWRFEAELEKEDGRWRVVTHHREAAKP
jgi:hypothetical protein